MVLKPGGRWWQPNELSEPSEPALAAGGNPNLNGNKLHVRSVCAIVNKKFNVLNLL